MSIRRILVLSLATAACGGPEASLPEEAAAPLTGISDPRGWITVPPCLVAAGARTCTTTLVWRSNNATNVALFVNGKSMASGASGSRVVPWLQSALTNPSGYLFELRSTQGTLASVSVKAAHAFTPTATRRLSEFGAIGNGVADDLAAIQRAIDGSAGYCIDGQNRTYRVVGTLTARQSLCLTNVTLVQGKDPLIRVAGQPARDTSFYIRSASQPWQNIPSGFVAYPEDIAVTGAEKTAVEASLKSNILVINGTATAPVAVNLTNVHFDRGRFPEMNQECTVKILLADPVRVDGLEITGAGHGRGVCLINSKNVVIDDLHLHDMIWAPYKGSYGNNTLLPESRIRAFGWNSAPFYEYQAGVPDAAHGKFVRIRAGEEIMSLTMLGGTQNVSITNATIHNIGAQFDTGVLPYQTDGIDASTSKNITIASSQIDQVWEGIDFTGPATLDMSNESFHFMDVTISNTFNFGFKMCHVTQNGLLERVTSVNAGISGFIIAAPSRDITVQHAVSDETGYIHTISGRVLSPWPVGPAFSVTQDGAPWANNIRFEDSTATNSVGHAAPYGFRNQSTLGGVNNSVHSVSARGFAEAISGFTVN